MSDYVDKYYEMDLKTDLYCPTGFLLQRGWVVLIESYGPKDDPTNNSRWADINYELARRWNRWGRVVETRLGTDGELYVTLCYDDQILKQLSCNPNLAWLVKKDSVETDNCTCDGMIVNEP